MQTENIAEIGIDESDRLYVKPVQQAFPYMYREAMEVYWNEELGVLHGPQPRQWSYLDWFKQIHAAAQAQDHLLRCTPETIWRVPEQLKQGILTYISSLSP